MIDVKTEAKETYAALAKVLEGYSDVLTVTRDGKTEAKAVTVVISGNRDVKTIAEQKTRYAAIDGRPSDLDGDTSAALVPWVSDSWKSHFKWDGTGAMPEEERKKLREFVAKATQAGAEGALLAAPETKRRGRNCSPRTWTHQHRKLKELEKFLRDR